MINIVSHDYPLYKETLKEGINEIYPFLVNAATNEDFSHTFDQIITIKMQQGRLYTDSKLEVSIDGDVIPLLPQDEIPIKAQIPTMNGTFYFDCQITKKKLKKQVEIESVCPICFTYLETKKVELNCGHEFCPDCITSWLNKSTGCPLCKTYVRKTATIKNGVVVHSKPLWHPCSVCKKLSRRNEINVCIKCGNQWCHADCTTMPSDEWVCTYCLETDPSLMDFIVPDFDEDVSSFSDQSSISNK